ncbi:MAG: hypothetical protein RLZZ519_3177 [Bacteroidota bacterium]|jgi:plasmid stabilization system protein ParE
MAVEVVWSEIAVDDFEMLYDQCASTKDIQAAERFRNQVLKLTDLLGTFPRLGMVDPWNKHLRRLRIDSDNFLVYSVGRHNVMIEGIVFYRRYRSQFPDVD